jgi:hypothetical protein
MHSSSPAGGAGPKDVEGAADGTAQALRLFLHIGTPKTGSTSLQYALFNNAEKLQAQGVLYPLGRFRRFAFQHHGMTDLLRSKTGDSLDAFLDGVREEALACGCHTVVLSSERIAMLPKADVKVLHEALLRAGFAPVVIVFFRSLLAQARSLTSEHMKAGMVLATPLKAGRALARLDESRIAARFMTVFGADNVIRHDLGESGDCIASFERDVGLSLSLAAERKNRRLDFATLSWLNAVNRDVELSPTIVQRTYEEVFPPASQLTVAEAEFLGLVAEAVGGEKGAALKQELQQHPAGEMRSEDAQLDYLRKYARFAKLLHRRMRRRALKRRLRRLLGTASDPAPSTNRRR